MTRAKIRVLHIIKGLDRGGAERLLLSTIRHHSPDFEFEVVYFLPRKSMLHKELTDAGARVTCLSVATWWGWLWITISLIRFIRRNGFDLIHAHLPIPGVIARLAGRVTAVPVVYTEHNLVNRYKILSRWCSKVTYGLQVQTLAVSQAVADSIHSTYVSDKPVCVISNGVDTDEFDPDRHNRQALRRKFGVPDQALVIGVVAVMTAQKRLDRWLECAVQISKQLDTAYFLVVGDGPLRADLEKQAANLLEAGKITFSGVVSVPAEWLVCMDIFLLTSDFEGLPVALLEAMSMGCVPICTAVGGIPAIIRHGENGFLIHSENTEEAKAIISQLDSNSESRKSVGGAARQTVRMAYSISRMISELEVIYRRIVRSKS